MPDSSNVSGSDFLAPNRPIFAFEIDGYDGELRVLTLSGHESISELFSFAIELAVDDDAIDFAATVGANAKLSLHYPDSQRDITGIVSRFEQRASTARFTPYYVEFVPKVWLMTQRYDCRIFQEKTAPDIIQEVFKRAGLNDAIKLNLRGSFPMRTYCVQYRETDWNFVSRLMEEEGIYYFFEATDSGTKMMIANTPQSHVDIDGDIAIPYRPPTGMVEAAEWIYEVRFGQRVRSGKVTLQDYNFATPKLDLKKDKKSTAEQGGTENLEVYDYPGLYKDDANGTRLAELRLQSILARAKELVGQSVCRRFTPGYKFELKDAPRSDFNGQYVITSVQHDGQQPLGENEAGGRYSYNNTFRAIPADVPFRPTRVTPKPIVEGVQTAVVTGPSGEEIHTDSYGRVKVQFPWDREGKKDDKTSCWIRVAQLWAGESWGAMFIPRIGHEVVVDFIEGDPDRPIITGRVYNAANMPPYALDGEKTKSTIKSNSSKGGGGFNEYRFEDKKGSEEIYQHGQKDLTIKTENDKNQITGHDETLLIGHDRTKTVKNDETTTVNGNRTETVDKDETITIKGNRTETVNKNETISIHGNRTETVDKDETITIGANRTEKVGGNENVGISGKRVHEITGNDSLGVKGDRSATIKGSDFSTVSGAMFLTVEEKISVSADQTMDASAKGSMTLTSDADITLKTGDASIVMKKDGTITIKGKDITIKGSGAISVKADKDVTIKGQKILQN
jgi:type VI secretion system secreted protein VgrG